MAVAHGDPALARHLRKSLELLRERSDDTEFRRLADDVLNGRADLREVYFTPAFNAGINANVENFARRYDEMSAEEQQALAEEGKQALDAERERLRRQR